MKKRTSRIPLILLVIFLSSFVWAQDLVADTSALQEETDILDEASEEYSEATLDIDAGKTPGQFGYFIDDFLDNFGDEAEVMAEKYAEMKQLLAEGKKEEAKIAFDNFKEYAAKLQENADPEDRDRIRKYIAAINHDLASLKDQGNQDLIAQVEDSARDTLNALELAKIIQDACSKLIELSASDIEAEIQFNNLCTPSEDSSNWHKEYYDDLTKEQQQEVKKFVKEIKSCFKDPANCDCSAATDNPSFINNCELITKAEVDCRAGDENACQVSEELGDEIFQSLEDKPYLREALADIEKEFSAIEDDRFDNHMPQECREAGATDRRSCSLVMFKLNAPEECITAVESGEIDISNEREARKQCERIMFEENAPQDCIDAGIDDFKECGKFMFKESAPQDCIEAGLTGESPRDHRKCEEIMKSLGRDGGQNRGRGPGINFDCRRIQNSEERLACFDKVVSGAQEQFDNRGEGSWPHQCREAGATTPESCEKVMREWGENQRDDRGFEDQREFSQDEQPSSSEQFDSSEQENEDFDDGSEHEGSSEEESSGTSSDSESSGSSSGEGESSAGITGSVIANNNRFLEYYFRFF